MKRSITPFSTSISNFKTRRVGKLLCIALSLALACGEEESQPVAGNAAFEVFSASGQTILPTSIDKVNRKVRLEVDHDADVTALVPDFETGGDHKVYANGALLVPGASTVNFSNAVNFEIIDEKNNTETTWEVEVMQLGCKILIDASHDGGVWWFPQSENFDPALPHQGESFANILRAKGFEVTELGRDRELSEEMFFGHYIIIRVGGFSPYSSRELEVYSNLIDRGMNLVFFTDHKANFVAEDKLEAHLGLEFKGSANGIVTDFTSHEITADLVELPFIAGSVLMNEEDPNITVLGRLGSDSYADLNFNDIQDDNEPVGSAVMGLLEYPNSRIFFIGDSNGLQIQPQPFIDNLIGWMGDCSHW
jgi:hypothetical protein